MHKNRGFTVIELMVVVAVVAVLASVAYPSYRDYLLRGKITEAVSMLSEIRVKAEQFYQDNRTYDGSCMPGTVAPVPVGKYFTVQCPVRDAANFSAQATGIDAQGMTGFIYQIDQAGNRQTISTGWGTCAGTPCWVLRKDCSC
jgi:type IV pilus assembly protein PilE